MKTQLWFAGFAATVMVAMALLLTASPRVMAADRPPANAEVAIDNFTKAGTYSYFCSVHPKMTGKVVVQ